MDQVGDHSLASVRWRGRWHHHVLRGCHTSQTGRGCLAWEQGIAGTFHCARSGFNRHVRPKHVLSGASRRWLDDYNLAGHEIISRWHYEFAPDIPERWKQAHLRGLAGEMQKCDEDPFEQADGTVQWIRWEVVPWREGDGSIGGIILFAEDITKHRETDQRLRLAASMFTNAREGITITDPDGNILEVNEMFTRITGYEREEVIGKNPRILKSNLQSDEFYTNMWRSLVSEGQWSGEIWNRNKSGGIYAETLNINAVRDAEGEVIQYVALFSDITQLKKHAQQLEHLTYYDVLTSLPNRALLADRLHQAMAQANLRKQFFAVAYLDLDGFKKINDKHGREQVTGC